MAEQRKKTLKPKAATPKAKPKRKAAKARKVVAPENKPLTKQERIFVKAYAKCKKPYDAAIEAGYSHATAISNAYLWTSNNKKKPNVYAAIQKELEKLEQKLEMSAENVLKQYWNIATADRNQLVENRRVPCRYCYGIDHKYQYTQGERDEAYDKHLDKLLMADKDIKDYPFNEKGGTGYTIHKPINPECPECHGLGDELVIMHDTNTLPPELKAVYAGVKETRHGKEILMTNPKDGLDAIARHLGLFNDKLKLQGDAENPLTLMLQQLGRNTLKPSKPDDKGDE